MARRTKQKCKTRLAPGNGADLRVLADIPPWDWPQDAGSRFLRVLTDRQATDKDRLVAAQLAGDLVVVNDELADALLGVVRSAEEPEALRAAAAISLGSVLGHVDTLEFDDPFDEAPITEDTFDRIKETLHRVYLDASVPVLVRRRILEASVRSPQDWHGDALREAWSGGSRDWMLTAVFAMQWVRGFDEQIVEALNSRDAEIRYEAVVAAGNWSVDAAWDHVSALAGDFRTAKPLKLAAIEAVGSIRPQEAIEILDDLRDSRDEDIAEAAEEALMMADLAAHEGDDGDEDEGEWF